MKDPETMKPKLTLYTITNELIETEEKLASGLAELLPLELEYQSELDKLLLGSQRASQQAREAEARELIRQNPLAEKYLTKKLDVKILYMRRDTLLQVSKNMISLGYEEARGGGL